MQIYQICPILNAHPEMDYTTYIDSLTRDRPPVMNPYLLSLWYDERGDWDQAHGLIQDMDTKEAAHIHAYLHRKERDNWNADYWYRQAGVKRPLVPLETEWKELVTLFLDQP